MLANKIAPTAVWLAFSAFLITHNPSPAITSELSYDSMFKEESATGGGLANAFFYLLSATGSPYGTVGTTAEQDEASKALVKPYLDPACQLQRASGERYTAATYLPADVDAFEIGDVRETPVSELRDHLLSLGAIVAWHDPLVSTWDGSKPVDLDGQCDVAILAIKQPGMNLEPLISSGVRILDCTNSLAEQNGVIAL